MSRSLTPVRHPWARVADCFADLSPLHLGPIPLLFLTRHLGLSRRIRRAVSARPPSLTTLPVIWRRVSLLPVSVRSRCTSTPDRLRNSSSLLSIDVPITENSSLVTCLHDYSDMAKLDKKCCHRKHRRSFQLSYFFKLIKQPSNFKSKLCYGSIRKGSCKARIWR